MRQVDKQTYITYVKRRRGIPVQVTSNLVLHRVKGKTIALVSFSQGANYYIAKTR
jgi:hypothetical protein